MRFLDNCTMTSPGAHLIGVVGILNKGGDYYGDILSSRRELTRWELNSFSHHVAFKFGEIGSNTRIFGNWHAASMGIYMLYSSSRFISNFRPVGDVWFNSFGRSET